MHPTFLGGEARQEVHRGSGPQRSLDDWQTVLGGYCQTGGGGNIAKICLNWKFLQFLYLDRSSVANWNYRTGREYFWVLKVKARLWIPICNLTPPSI